MRILTLNSRIASYLLTLMSDLQFHDKVVANIFFSWIYEHRVVLILLNDILKPRVYALYISQVSRSAETAVVLKSLFLFQRANMLLIDLSKNCSHTSNFNIYRGISGSRWLANCGYSLKHEGIGLSVGPLVRGVRDTCLWWFCSLLLLKAFNPLHKPIYQEAEWLANHGYNLKHEGIGLSVRPSVRGVRDTCLWWFLAFCFWRHLTLSRSLSSFIC